MNKDIMNKYESHLRNFEVDEARGILNGHIPSKLYCYRKYPDKYVERDVQEEKICFSDPVLFNDPLEAVSDCNNIQGVMSNYVAIDDCQSKHTEGRCIRVLNRRSVARCVCFSDTVYSVPMWAHYADRGTGICIEYDPCKFNHKELLLMKIVYSDEILENKLSKDEQIIKKLICSAMFKGRAWSYENEWRLFNLDKKALDDLRFEMNVPGAITAIYLGLNCVLDRKLIMWANDRGIKLYKMVRKIQGNKICLLGLRAELIRKTDSQV